MKQITAYKLSDGNIVENEEQAKEEQALIDFKEGINVFCSDHYYSDMDEFDFSKMLFENRVELYALFHPKE